jgi:hypothetical protein
VFLLQLLGISFLHNNELINTDKTDDAYITEEEISTHKLLCGLWIVLMHTQPNIEVMGFNPSTSLLQYRIQHYTQIYTQELQNRSMGIIPFSGLSGRVHPRYSGAPPACSSGSLEPYHTWP